MFRHVQFRRTRLAAGTALVSALAVGGVTAAGAAGHTGPHQGGQPEPPRTTTAADWKGVADTLGRSSTLMGGTVYRVALPRTDLKVTSHDVAVKPGLSLGGYAAFAQYKDGAVLMGDLVVTEPELQKVTDALQAAGIDQTAVHKHLLSQQPDAWWTHIHAMGDPVTLAKGVKAAKAAINGDFVMTQAETQKVIQALRKGHIDIVELHNHGQDEQPRLFYLHFWATGDGVALAESLRPALDATASAPPS
ncbi:DUF1259 domain-containing protein [Streptomyces sp. NPDC001678]|uniref:DUF1259 domain-containing protein n=1 Tax=Streptomyces sp. NPDC001678 TaxID=3364599 RepID=UPI0036BC2C60